MKKTRTKKRTSGSRKGTELFNQVVRLTGIPTQSIKRELKSVLDKKNLDVNHLTLDQLRQVAASYLREIMGSLLDRTGPVRRDETTH